MMRILSSYSSSAQHQSTDSPEKHLGKWLPKAYKNMHAIDRVYDTRFPLPDIPAPRIQS